MRAKNDLQDAKEWGRKRKLFVFHHRDEWTDDAKDDDDRGDDEDRRDHGNEPQMSLFS